MQTIEERVSPSHAALLVIDMENDFCHSEGAMAKNGANVSSGQAIVPALRELIAEGRAAGLPIVFIRMVQNQWTQSEARQARRREGAPPSCQEGTWGVDWYSDLVPAPGDLVVNKHRFNAFLGTDLDLLLKARGIKALICTGTATDVCVASTAREAAMRDYETIIPEDCSASSRPEMHRAALTNFAQFFGMVTTSDEIIQAWSKVRSGVAV